MTPTLSSATVWFQKLCIYRWVKEMSCAVDTDRHTANHCELGGKVSYSLALVLWELWSHVQQVSVLLNYLLFPSILSFLCWQGTKLTLPFVTIKVTAMLHSYFRPNYLSNKLKTFIHVFKDVAPTSKIHTTVMCQTSETAVSKWWAWFCLLLIFFSSTLTIAEVMQH